MFLAKKFSKQGKIHPRPLPAYLFLLFFYYVLVRDIRGIRRSGFLFCYYQSFRLCGGNGQLRRLDLCYIFRSDLLLFLRNNLEFRCLFCLFALLFFFFYSSWLFLANFGCVYQLTVFYDQLKRLGYLCRKSFSERCPICGGILRKLEFISNNLPELPIISAIAADPGNLLILLLRR